MCDIAERIESSGIDSEQFMQVLEKRQAPTTGKWSAHSITLIVLGVVEDERKRRPQVVEE